MKPSDYIKSHGLPSLAHVAREADVSERTLFNWYHNHFKRFEKIVFGCLLEQKMREYNMTIEILNGVPAIPGLAEILERANKGTTTPCQPTTELPQTAYCVSKGEKE